LQTVKEQNNLVTSKFTSSSGLIAIINEIWTKGTLNLVRK